MPTIDVVTARDGRVIPIQWSAGGGCTGCIGGSIASSIASSIVACAALPPCGRGNWTKAQNTAALGPYLGAYVLYKKSRHESTHSKYSIDWSNPKYQVEDLQRMVRDMRGYGDTQLPYAVKTALDKFGLPKDWHKLALEFPEDEGNGSIGFCATAAKLHAVMVHGNESQRTTTTAGRYIRRHWPEAKDHEIRDVTTLAESNGVTITYDMDEMIDAVQCGPTTCMQWDEADSFDTWYMTGSQYYTDEGEGLEFENNTTTVHPYHAYAPELGWGMAVRKDNNRIVARALTYKKDGVKCFVRSYGKDSDGYSGSDVTIDAYLKHNGYEYLDAWPEGVAIKANKHEGGDWCVPYVDPGPSRITWYGRCFRLDGDVFIRDNNGEYEFGETDGSYFYCRRATRVAPTEAREASNHALGGATANTSVNRIQYARETDFGAVPAQGTSLRPTEVPEIPSSNHPTTVSSTDAISISILPNTLFGRPWQPLGTVDEWAQRATLTQTERN